MNKLWEFLMKKKIIRLGVFGDGSYNPINLINFSWKATECGLISTDHDESLMPN